MSFSRVCKTPDSAHAPYLKNSSDEGRCNRHLLQIYAASVRLNVTRLVPFLLVYPVGIIFSPKSFYFRSQVNSILLRDFYYIETRLW